MADPASSVLALRIVSNSGREALSLAARPIRKGRTQALSIAFALEKEQSYLQDLVGAPPAMALRLEFELVPIERLAELRYFAEAGFDAASLDLRGSDTELRIELGENANSKNTSHRSLDGSVRFSASHFDFSFTVDPTGFSLEGVGGTA